MDPSMATGAPASDESRRTCEPIERMTLLARVFRATPGERFTRWSAIRNHSPLGHDGLGWSAMALPGRGPLGPFDRRCGMRWLRLAILREEGTAMRWSTHSSSYRYDPFDHFPSEDQLTRLPLGDGWELRQLVIEGNGKDAELRLVIADGRRIELGCGHVKVAVQGSLLTEVMGPGDCSLRVRYSHLAGGRLLLRTFSILHPGSEEEARSDLLAFERGDRLLWVIPHISLQLEGRSGS